MLWGEGSLIVISNAGICTVHLRTEVSYVLECLLQAIRHVCQYTFDIQSNFDGSNPLWDHENLFETRIVRATEGY